MIFHRSVAVMMITGNCLGLWAVSTLLRHPGPWWPLSVLLQGAGLAMTAWLGWGLSRYLLGMT